MKRIRRVLGLLKTKSVLINWGLSYLFILLIPIIFGVFNNRLSSRILSAEIEKANDIVLESFKNDVDGTLESLRYTSATVIKDERFTGVANASSGSLLWTSYQCAAFFNIHRVSNPNLSIFMYISDSNHAVSHQTANTLPMLYEALSAGKRALLSSGEWEDYLNLNRRGEFIISPYLSYTNFDKDAFVYQSNLQVYIPETGGKRNVNLFVSIPCNELAVLSSDVMYMITDLSGNRLWGWNNDIDTMGGLFSELGGAEGNFRFSSDGTEYLCNYIPSSETGWYYMVVTPMDKFQSQSAVMAKNLFLTTMLSMACGVALMIWFVTRNYMPLSEILSAMNAADAAVSGNEYEIIKEAFGALEQENTAIRSNLAAQRESIREKYLLSLLVGRTDRRLESDVARRLGEMYGDKKVAVVSVRMDCDAMQQMALSENERMFFDVMTFAVDNVFAELLGGRYLYSKVQDGDFAVYVFAIGEGADITGAEGLKSIKTLCTFFEEKFGAEMTVVISGAVESIEHVSQAYGEVLDIFAYADDAGQTGIISAGEISSVPDSRSPRRNIMERRLMRCVETGDIAGGASTAKELMDDILGGTSLPPRAAANLLFIVPEKVLEVFALVVPEGAEELERLGAAIGDLGGRPSEEVSAGIIAIVKHACTYIAVHSGEQSSGIAARVMRFIDDNFADPNLNITSIAVALDISAKTVSHHFRRSTGVGVLDYINQVRIEAAKDIAARQSVSIEGLSSMVGYTSVKTFRRAFARFEGMTPGRFFRKMQDDKGEE